MDCQRCGKGFAEWQCRDCGKIVCTDCVRNTESGVYCSNCYDRAKKIGQNPNVSKKKGHSSIKKILITLIILDIGLALIMFIGNYFIGQIQTEFGQQYVVLFQNFGETLLYGIVGITVALFVVYIVFEKLLNK